MSDTALPETQLIQAAPWRGVVWSRVAFALAVLGIGLVAVVARAYEIRDIPRLTDETDEVMRGLAIARGEILPLTNVDAYIGPLWSYLLALGFAIFGPGSLLPRVLTLLAALTTVAAAYWLGRELALRLNHSDSATLLGLATAALLATSSFHAIVSARIAWSHALTPLAMTVAVACLLRWERTRDGRALAGLGLAYGMAVHTHPTALAFAPGLGVWALLHWRTTLASRAGWLALGLFLLANAPMLAFNLATGFRSASEAAQVQSAYVGGPAAFGSSYLRNAGLLLTSWPLLLGGDIGERRGGAVTLDDPVVLVYAALALVGLLVTVRHGILAPLLLLASGALVLPVFNGKYEPLFNGRYLAPLLPLGFTLLALGVTSIVERVSGFRSWRGAVVSVAVIVLTVPPLLALVAYIRATSDAGPNNRELYRAAEIVGAVATSKPVLVDATLSGTRVSTGREGTGVLEYLLILDGGLDVRRYQPADLAEAVERGESDLVVVSPRLLTRLDKDFITEPPPGEDEARSRRRAAFVVVRIVGHAHHREHVDLVANYGADR